MKVEGRANFTHSEDKPFKAATFNAEIIPDTPVEHDRLQEMVVSKAWIIIEQSTGRCYVQAELGQAKPKKS